MFRVPLQASPELEGDSNRERALLLSSHLMQNTARTAVAVRG